MSGRYERCSHNERPSRCLYCKDAELDRLNAQALELCAEISGLRRALQRIADFDQWPHSDRETVRLMKLEAATALVAKEGER